MLLTYDDRQESGWVVTRLRCGIHIGQLFQTQAKMYWPYDYCKYSQVLHGSESDEEDTKDPERHFDAEVNTKLPDHKSYRSFGSYPSCLQ